MRKLYNPYIYLVLGITPFLKEWVLLFSNPFWHNHVFFFVYVRKELANSTTELFISDIWNYNWVWTFWHFPLFYRLRCIVWDISRSFLLRLAISIFTVILIYTMAQVNTFTCSVDYKVDYKGKMIIINYKT